MRLIVDNSSKVFFFQEKFSVRAEDERGKKSTENGGDRDGTSGG